MSDNGPATTRKPGRLASVFDGFPPGSPFSLDDLELAMSRDLDRRCVAALDRALARLAAPPLVTPSRASSPPEESGDPDNKAAHPAD